MTPKGSLRPDIERAVWFSFEYFWRYLTVGLVPVLVVGTAMQLKNYLWYPVIVHAVSAVLLIPGAILVNVAGLRYFPSRTWTGDRRRPWLAGTLSVILVWVGFFIMIVLELEPGKVLKAMLGTELAWLFHFGGVFIVASTIALAIAWALPPTPTRVLKIRRPLLKLPRRSVAG
jgi:hypothetical protein